MLQPRPQRERERKLTDKRASERLKWAENGNLWMDNCAYCKLHTRTHHRHHRRRLCSSRTLSRSHCQTQSCLAHDSSHCCSPSQYPWLRHLKLKTHFQKAKSPTQYFSLAFMKSKSAIEFDSNIPRSNLWSWFACRWWANGYNNFFYFFPKRVSVSPISLPAGCYYSGPARSVESIIWLATWFQLSFPLALTPHRRSFVCYLSRLSNLTTFFIFMIWQFFSVPCCPALVRRKLWYDKKHFLDHELNAYIIAYLQSSLYFLGEIFRWFSAAVASHSNLCCPTHIFFVPATAI